MLFPAARRAGMDAASGIVGTDLSCPGVTSCGRPSGGDPAGAGVGIFAETRFMVDVCCLRRLTRLNDRAGGVAAALPSAVNGILAGLRVLAVC